MKSILLLATIGLCSCASQEAKILTGATIDILERRGEISEQDADDLHLGKEIVFKSAPAPVTLPVVEVSK